MTLSTHDSLENFNKPGPAAQLAWESPLWPPATELRGKRGRKRHTHVYNSDTATKTALSEAWWRRVWDKIWSQLLKLRAPNQACTCSAVIGASFSGRLKLTAKTPKSGRHLVARAGNAGARCAALRSARSRPALPSRGVFPRTPALLLWNAGLQSKNKAPACPTFLPSRAVCGELGSESASLIMGHRDATCSGRLRQ